jgi:pimeloyl-ACP methyl ester carboxylesterase
MAYTERGSGPPLVLVHGAGLDYRYWAGQMEPFSAKYRTIAVSLRHYFPEPWRGDGEFSLSQHVADLIAFIKQLGVGSVHLVGHSRGGTVALYAVVADSLIAKTLVFAEGGLGMAKFAETDPVEQEQTAQYVRSLTAKFADGDIDGGLEAVMTRISGPGAWQAMPETSRQVFRDNAWTLVAGLLDNPRWPALGCEDTKRLELPVLIVGGANSLPKWHLLLDKFQSCFQRAERVVIPNAGHAMSLMNPVAFNGAVLGFLDRN